MQEQAGGSLRHEPRISREGALAGMRVLEVGEGVSAPFAAKLLADYGAEVLKIEPPEGDPSRRHGPFPDDARHPERSALFLYLNTNKQSLTLDLRQPAAGRDGRLPDPLAALQTDGTAV